MKYLQLLVLSSLVGFNAYAGSVEVYFNHNSRSSYTDPYRNISRPGDNLEDVILKQIASARKSIFVAVQEFRLPLVAQALIDKRKSGVDVRVVIENSYNNTVVRQRDDNPTEHEASKLTDLKALVDVNKNGRFEKEELESRDAIYMLQNAKIPFMDDSSDGSAGSGLMHHKFMIVDGKKTVVSTANFTPSCIHGDMSNPSTRGNANSMMVVDSVSFAKIFTDEFSQLWGNGKRGNFGQGKTYRGPQTVTAGGVRLTVQFSPTSQHFAWEESVNGLIGKYLKDARRSIKAALFVFSDQRLSDSMEKANNAGAEIGIVMEPNFAFRPYSELLDVLGLEMLNEKCALEPDNEPWKKPIREAGMANLPRGDVLHHKFGVIDGRTVIVGSQNWSESANYINDETLVVIEDTGIADQFTQEYNRLRGKATFGAPSWIKEQIKKQETACHDQGKYR